MSDASLRYRLLVTLAQAALLVCVFMASDGRYRGIQNAPDTIPFVLSWLPALVKGFVFGVLAATAYVAIDDPSSIRRVIATPSTRGGASIHFAAGLLLMIGSAATPPLLEVKATTPSWPLAFYLLSPALWATYVLAGYRLLVPTAAIRDVGARRRAWIICAIVVMAMLAWHYFEELDYPNAFGITSASVTIASWFSVLLGNPIHPIGINERGWPVYQMGDITAIIAPTCAGTEGLFLSTALLLTLIAIEHDRLHLPKALGFVAMAAALTFIVNSLRLALLFYIGTHWSTEIATNGFHSNFGVLTMVVVSATFTAAIHRYASRAPAARQPAIRPAATSGRGEITDAQDTRLIMPQMVMIGCVLVFGLVSGKFNWCYPLTIAIVASVLWRLKAIDSLARWKITLPSVAAGMIAFAVWIALVRPDLAASQAFANTLFSQSALVSSLWLLSRLIGSIVIVPIVEEMAFRGFLLPWITNRLESRLGLALARASALATTSIMFGLAHADMLAATAAGLIYGCIKLYRAKYTDAILAHGITNICLCLYALQNEYWSYL